MGESGLEKEQMSTTEALNAWKSFLETTPPNTPLKIPGLFKPDPLGRWYFKPPQIQLHCEDDGPRRFVDTYILDDLSSSI